MTSKYMDYTKLSRATDLSDPKERFLYRFFETLPGVLAWATLLLIVLFSFTAPLWIAIFIILFDIYWLIKTIFLSFHLRQAFKQLRENMTVNWMERLKQLPTANYELRSVKSWQDVYHLVILPMYKESTELVSASVESVMRADYPKNKMIVVLAQEERAGEEHNRMVREYLEKEYGSQFFKFITTTHPADLPGEIPGKGANATYGARVAKEKIIDALNIQYDHIIVSNLDIDTVVPAHYFSLLTHLYLTTPDSLHTSFQPIPLYTNNIWEAPALARVVAFSATFWHTIQQERPERLTTFSSHSMPFQALVDIDFWQTNMVSEDSRVFWQCFLRYNGQYRVTPMFYSVAMDANVTPTFWQTLKNIYKQQRRWGYGVENVPYFLFGFHKNKQIPLRKKIYYVFNVLEGFHSWATNALIIFMLGWLPVWAGGPEFNQTVLSLNLPQLTRTIMSLAMVGMISSAVLSLVLLPPRPPQYRRFSYVWMVAQWILFPITTILLGAFPGIEAQTRLMLGKYLGFWVTPKYMLNRKS
ncbi:MAG: glycosyltransferase family 2 protein [bacterium]|nr:glycosyltransferase family 2 protein [bacterium]